MRLFFIIIIFLWNYIPISACINLEIIELNRKSFYPSTPIELPKSLYINREKLENKLIEIEELIDEENGNLLLENNYAGILIYLERYEEAKLMLELNQKEYPDMYSVNSNLGTLYELLDLNEEAYNLIEKAIRVNNKSHSGSEWIHLKILDVKRKDLDTKEYLEDNSIIFTDSLSTYNTPQKKRLKKIGQQLEYQLIERMTFIKENDLIVGRLLFELGLICKILGNYEEGIKIFKASKEYGFVNNKIEAELNLLKQILKSEKSESIKNQFYSFKRVVMKSRKLQLILAILPILLFFLGYYGLKIWKR